MGPRGAAPAPFTLAVDDLGSLLVVAGDELVLGHVRAGEADLPFLADVGPRHARLRRERSFSAGSRWLLEPVDGERVLARGLPLAGPRALADGDEVELGVNLAFRYRRTDPASESALLSLQRGAECRGSASVLLLAPGPGGRVRVGPGPHCLLRTAAPAREIRLELRGSELWLASESVAVQGGAPRSTLVLAVPPAERVDVMAPRGEGGAPFALSLLP